MFESQTTSPEKTGKQYGRPETQNNITAEQTVAIKVKYKCRKNMITDLTALSDHRNIQCSQISIHLIILKSHTARKMMN